MIFVCVVFSVSSCRISCLAVHVFVLAVLAVYVFVLAAVVCICLLSALLLAALQRALPLRLHLLFYSMIINSSIITISSSIVICCVVD